MSDGSHATLHHDALTGALTRHHFEQLLNQGIEQAIAEHTTLTVLVIDVDHFKSINDSFGHGRGDLVLVEVAGRLRHVLRTNDLLFRFGGDEFVVFLPAPSRLQALAVADRLLHSIAATPFDGQPALNLTLSIGAATFPDDAETATELFNTADRRVFHAKRSGRGCVSVVDVQHGPVLLQPPARMLERDAALLVARELLDSTDPALRMLCVQAAPGLGRTRFLAEIERIAVAFGYATLAIKGGPGLRARRYGALLAAAHDWPTPPPAAGPEAFIVALTQAAHARGARRLLIMIDDPSEIDPATLDFLVKLASSAALTNCVLVYIDGLVWSHRFSREAATHTTVALNPLSSQAILIWLRQLLHWEPPASLVRWISQYSDGFPRRINYAVDELISAGALVQHIPAWRWDVSLALGIPAYQEQVPDIVRILDRAPLLVGRDHEVAAVHELLLANRLVTIVGHGGVGKTRLALQVAAEYQADFRQPTFLVQLAGVQQPNTLPTAISAVLDLPATTSSDPFARLASYLGSRTILLVLDNFEQLIDGAAVLTELLRAAPNLRMLVSSRVQLGLPDEQCYRIDGLALPDDEHSMSAAIELFYQRAIHTDGGFAPTSADQQAIVAICRLLNGLPLGIELAASFCQSYRCTDILAELERSLSFLTDRRAEQMAHHRSLVAVLDSFWELLSVHEQQAFQALAVFRGGFTREAARAIAGASSFFLDALTARMIVRRDANGRFTMHELLRQYAAQQLQAQFEVAATAYDQHSAYYLERLALRYGTARASQGHEPYVLEIDNLRAAWEWAVANQRLDRIGRAMNGYANVLVDLGLLREGVQVCTTTRERIEQACKQAGREDLLRLLDVTLSGFYYHTGRYQEALELAQVGIGLDGLLDREYIHASALMTTGVCYMVLGDHSQADVTLEAARIAAEGHPRLLSEILNTLTHMANLTGRHERATAYGQQALLGARAAGDHTNEHLALLFLGIGQIFTEQFTLAHTTLESIIVQPETIQRISTVILALANMGQASWSVQEYQRAASEVERAIRMARTVDMPYLAGLGLRVCGLVALSTGRLSQSEEAFAQALAIFSASNAVRDLTRTRVELALLRCWQGAFAQAHTLTSEALEMVRAQGYVQLLGTLLLVHGHACLAQGEHGAAAESYQTAYDHCRALGHPNQAIEARAGLLELALGDDQQRAIRQHGQDVIAHLAQGMPMLAGMSDPARVCLNALAAVELVAPAATRHVYALAEQLLARVMRQLDPEHTEARIAALPSLFRLRERLQR